MTSARQLSTYFSGQATADLPERHLHEMKRLLLDYLGVALSGSRTESGRIAADFVIEMSGVPQATLIGRDVQVPAMNAAFANAIAEHSIELDDVDDEALFHYGPPVVSAVLAVAESVNATGADTLAALLAGCEMTNRLSRAANPSLRDRGFHTTPTCGVFGAAVGAGRILRLSADQLCDALGLAGAQASGLMEMYGVSMQKRFNPGPAARNGVTAALLAARGFTGADTIIDGERGFLAAFVDERDLDKLVEDLGSDIPVTVEYKPYSCARPIHNAIDCALEIRNGHGVKAADIESLVMYRHPFWASYHLNAEPRTYHEAQVSLPYSVAVAFADGAALFDQYSDERLTNDHDLMALAKKVEVHADPSLARGVSCRLVVTTKDGQELSAEVDYPKGSTRNPMSDDEIRAKFRLLSESVISSDQAERLATLVFDLDECPDIRALTALTH